MKEVLTALVYASERAANIARSCFTESVNTTLLVTEKCGGDANTRFDRDFKTIADVLAQESARYEIALRSPDLAKHLRGEECAEINGITIKRCHNEESTVELLCSLVPLETARNMAKAAHGELNIDINIPGDLNEIVNPCDLGVWIDPIDATAEFIEGVSGQAKEGRGLPCVTVLIGAYVRSTGEPIVGVINQPFINGGKGRIVWGLCYGDTRQWSGGDMPLPVNKTVLMSSAEDPAIAEKFKARGWEVKSVPGAGHKLLKVVLGEAAAYIVCMSSTFRWDSCGPHAVLRARGGDVLSCVTLRPLSYNDPGEDAHQPYANSGGLLAYTDANILAEIIDIIR